MYIITDGAASLDEWIVAADGKKNGGSHRRTTQPPVEFRYTRKDLNDRKRHLKFNEAGKRVQNSMEIGQRACRIADSNPL